MNGKENQNWTERGILEPDSMTLTDLGREVDFLQSL